MNLLSQLFGRSATKKRRLPRVEDRLFEDCLIEQLENRQMLAGNAFATFTSQAAFEAGAGAKAQPELSNEGRVGDTVTVGDMTFSHADGHDLWLGTGSGDDWTSLTDGPDLALNDRESFNIDFAEPVNSFGMNVVDAHTETSRFSLTMFSDGEAIGTSHFRPEFNEVSFVGLVSAEEFDRVEIRENIGGPQNEYFSGFMTGTKAKKDLGTKGFVRVRGDDIVIRGTQGSDEILVTRNNVSTPEFEVTTGLNAVDDIVINTRGGSDQVQIGFLSANSQTVNGKLTIKTGHGKDLVSLGSSLLNGLSVNTGAGNDSLQVGTDRTRGYPALNGRVSIKMGAGDDSVRSLGNIVRDVDSFLVHGGGGLDEIDSSYFEDLGATVTSFEFDN